MLFYVTVKRFALQIAADNAIFGQTGPKVGSFDAGYGSSQMVRLIGEHLLGASCQNACSVGAYDQLSHPRMPNHRDVCKACMTGSAAAICY